MRLFFKEFSWALTADIASSLDKFIPPTLTDVSNLAHPLFKQLSIPHILLRKPATSANATTETVILPLTVAYFDCVYVEIVSSGLRVPSSQVEPLPRVPKSSNTASAPPAPPKRLTNSLTESVYGHSPQNDLSSWGDEYIRVIYALNYQNCVANLTSPEDKIAKYLWVEVLFQLGPYSWDPKHEPSGWLQAARFIPATTVLTNSPLIDAFRVDFHFQLAMDGLVEDATEPGHLALAGTFRDNEMIGNLSDAVNGASRGPGAAAFDAAEKPLLREICTTGWIPDPPASTVPKQSTEPTPQTPDCWDNVHMWPGQRKDGKYSPALPSTPGAFLALHCHWRWPHFLSDYWQLYFDTDIAAMLRLMTKPLPSSFDKAKEACYAKLMESLFPGLNPANSSTQWKGLNLCANKGGPLFDPRIADQTVQFAILSRSTFDPTGDFQFNKSLAGSKGAVISEGAELDYWMSFAPQRSSDGNDGQFGGTVFPHGVYFGHNLFTPDFSGDLSLSGLTEGYMGYNPENPSDQMDRLPVPDPRILELLEALNPSERPLLRSLYEQLKQSPMVRTAE